jgi:hypothetical protein
MDNTAVFLKKRLSGKIPPDFSFGKIANVIKAMPLLICVGDEVGKFVLADYKIVNLTITSKRNLYNLKLLYIWHVLCFSEYRRYVPPFKTPSGGGLGKPPNKRLFIPKKGRIKESGLQSWLPVL